VTGASVFHARRCDAITQQKIAIDEIRIGCSVRKHVGDIDELAASIQRLGQLQPVAIDQNNPLIAGWRGIQAMEELGSNTICYTVVNTFDDALNALMAERDENVCTKPLHVD